MQQSTKDKLKKAAPIALGSSMLVLSMMPAAAAFAANNYITNVTTTANGTSVKATSNTNPKGLHVWYQFRATTPQGHSWILRKFEAGNTFTWTPPQAGNYTVQAFALTQYQVGTKQWTKAIAGTTTTDSRNVVSSLSITGAPTANIATNTSETLGVVAKTSSGTVVTNPGTPTWSLPSGTTGATIQTLSNGGVVFDATAAGSYTVTATLDGQTATSTIVVYGAAVAVKLTPASSSLVADGVATDTVTATVVDANGNTVANYNGTATLSGTGLSMLTAASSQPSDFDASTDVLTFTNGMATFSVGPTTAIGESGNFTLTPSSSSLTSGSLTLNAVSPTVTQLALAIASGSTNALSANGQTSTQVTLSAEDAQGNTWSSEPGSYATVTLSGPGSLSASSSVTSETVYIPTSGSTNVTVYSLPGEAGTVSISATSTGLTSAALSVSSYINTTAASLGVTSTTGTTAVHSNPYTLYSVQVLDTNGHPMPDATGTVTVTSNAGAQSGAIQLGTISSAGSFNTSGAGDTFTITNGVAQFAVETTTVGTNPVTLTITPSDTAIATATTSYSFTAEAASQLAITPDVAYVANAGQSVTVSTQLEDTNGNNVSQAGVPITFSLPTNVNTVASLPNSQSTYTVDTNASGVASVTFPISASSSGGSFTVMATGTNLGTQTTPTITVNPSTSTASYSTQVAILNGVYGTGTADTSYSMTAGTSIPAIYAYAENAIGGKNSSDTLMLTSSNPSVVSVNSSAASGVVSGEVSTDLTANAAGTATITVQDISDNSMPKATFTVSVQPGLATGAVLEYNGAPLSSSNEISAVAGQPVALQVVNADSVGDPVPVTGSAALTADLTATGVTGDFSTSSTGAPPVTSVQIQPGQSEVTVYFDPAQNETIGASGTTLSAAYQASGAAASGTTTTNYAPASTGTKAVEQIAVTGTESGTTAYTVTVDGTNVSVTPSATGETDTTAAADIASALNGNATVAGKYTIASSGADVTLTQKTPSSTQPVVSSSGASSDSLTLTPSETTMGASPTAATPSVYTLTVSAGATNNGMLSVNVTAGSLNQTVDLTVSAGQTAAEVAAAIASALEGNSTITGAFTVANPNSGDTVTLTQNTASSTTTAVTVTN